MPDPNWPWIVRPASARTQREWDAAMRSAPNLMTAVRERLRRDPLDRSDNPGRTHRLQPPLDAKRIGDRVLPQGSTRSVPPGRSSAAPMPRSAWSGSPESTWAIRARRTDSAQRPASVGRSGVSAGSKYWPWVR